MQFAPMHLTHGLAALVVAALLSTPTRAEDDKRPAEIGVLGGAVPLLPIGYRVDLRDEGPVYQAVAHLTFRNSRMATVEGVALVPVAPGSIPRGVLVVNGSTRMRGVVRSRERAVDAYRILTRGLPGRDPAVVEQLDDRWLKATLAPVAADDAVELQVSYLGFSERIGARRMVDLPSPRRALRANGGGAAPRWIERGAGRDAPDAAPGAARGAVDCRLGTWCFRGPGGEGTFCLELDPSAQLSTPLPRVTELLVIETPESTTAELAHAGGELLAAVAADLRDGDRVEFFSDARDQGQFGEIAAADVDHRAALGNELGRNEARGWGRLEQRIAAALARAESVEGPVRLVVVSSQRRIAHAAELRAAVARAAFAHGDDFACFTVAVGPSAEASELAACARAGGGRAFVLPAASDVARIAPVLAAAVSRPVLRGPEITVAGASEIVAEGKLQVTYGETVRVVGRYDEAMTTLVRLQGKVRGVALDLAMAAEFPEEDVAHPWVATTWAGLRARELRRTCTGQPADPYLTRLCERYGLLGPETVSLSLEEALSNRMPPLIGEPGEPVARLDPPVVPAPPSEEPTPVSSQRDPGRTLPGTPNIPRSPSENPSQPAPNAPAPSLPSPGPSAPSRPPPVHGGHR